jgi:hypothetical protein
VEGQAGAEGRALAEGRAHRARERRGRDPGVEPRRAPARLQHRAAARAARAHFVFVGRPFLYAAAIAGAEGVRHAASLLRDEISRDMAMLGISSLTEMKRDLLVPAQGTVTGNA